MMGLFKVYKNSTLFHRLVSILSIDILVKASGFILLPIYLRLMTQDEFGLYNYILAIVQTFSLVLNLGLYIPQTKLYHTYTSSTEKGQLLFTINATLLGAVTFLCTVFYLFGLDDWLIKVLFGGEDYKKYKLFIGMALIISVFTFMLSNFFYTSEKIRHVKAYNIYRIFGVNIFSLMALYFFASDSVSLRLGFTYGVEFLILCVFGVFFVKEIVPVYNGYMMKKSFRMGLPIMLSAVFGIIVNFGDKFLLQRYGSLADLSNYFLAFSFASVIPLIFGSLQNVWLPIFIKEKDVQKNFEKTRRLIPKLLLMFLVIAVGIWLLFMLLLWVGVIPSKYDGVQWILPLLLITQTLAAITPMFSNYLVYFERTDLVSVSGLFVGVISIALGLWLIPSLGVLGAAITTLIVNSVYLILYYYLVSFLKKKHLVTR